MTPDDDFPDDCISPDTATPSPSAGPEGAVPTKKILAFVGVVLGLVLSGYSLVGFLVGAPLFVISCFVAIDIQRHTRTIGKPRGWVISAIDGWPAVLVLIAFIGLLMWFFSQLFDWA